ncbi:hypothetical protein NUACC21_01630 [Scytonema sp. NUACC21]
MIIIMIKAGFFAINKQAFMYYHGFLSTKSIYLSLKTFFLLVLNLCAVSKLICGLLVQVQDVSP